jgi:hydrogenase maturation protein HypF
MTGPLPRHPSTAAIPGRRRCRLEIAGTVQGVGFRPFLWRRAQALGLAGFAMNDGDGVVTEVEGAPAQIAAFIRELGRVAPANAVIRDLAVRAVPIRGDIAFTIRESAGADAPTTSVPPDLATCPACLAEIFDRADRRYLYPFTNCTDCGPRYSIIEALPYDRVRTAMRRFTMCPTCAAEYADPANRRFHAEPNACPDCGPQLALWDTDGRRPAARHEALLAAADRLRRGGIIAVKGLGGFQLLADARDSAAVARLRVRKRRGEKPFAVMFPSLAAVRSACDVSPEEEMLLAGKERPIVLLRRRGADVVAAAVAPHNPCLGVMLPYTPLHHLLMAELAFPVVATSGNLSEEPIAVDEHEALARLGGVADCFLVHDRPILRPVDDSVARILGGRPQVLRRARGYAPAAVACATAHPGILAAGGHLKATLALTRREGTVLSQHIGDLDGPLARDAHAGAGADLLRLYGVRPRVLACDLHPDYHSTRWAEELAADNHLTLVRVQHHLAHVAAAMAEHGISPPVLGIAWDGTGYGTDGTVWGGEFLLVTDENWRRVGHLRPFRLPGGAAAVREPRRAALGLLFELCGEAVLDMERLPPVATFPRPERRTLLKLLAQDMNTPITSSAGRLFDGVSALLGLCQVAGYEGQAACRLEWCADGAAAPGRGYVFPVTVNGEAGQVVDWGPALRRILADLAAGVTATEIAAAFHTGLADAMAVAAAGVGVKTVVLTGGCFQNALLTRMAAAALEAAGHRVYWHERVPPGDGGLALGQAAWADRLLANGELPCA